MKKVVIYICLLVSTYSFSQEREWDNDSLRQKSIQLFREVYWNNLPKPKGFTNDYEKLFSEEEEKVLDSLLISFEKETTIEIGIVTINTLKVSEEKFEDFTLHIAKKWGFGKIGKDNGILIVISKGYRRIRIQNGDGIEKIISDIETKEIIDNYFIPYFRKNEYFEGSKIGIEALFKLLKSKI